MLVEPTRASLLTGTASGAEITRSSHEHSDANAFDRLFILLYQDFRSLARSYLAREAQSSTMQATALVNEAYLKLAAQKQVDWKGRTHLLAVGAVAMRRILINHATSARREKRGGGAIKLSLREDLISTDTDIDVLVLDEALRELAKLNERHARLVELRFFMGLNTEELAGVLGVSKSTVEKDWRFCSAWLKNVLKP